MSYIQLLTLTCTTLVYSSEGGFGERGVCEIWLFLDFGVLTMFPMAFPQIPNDILGAGLIFWFCFLGDGETNKLVSISLRVELMNLHPTTCQPNVRLNQKVFSQNFFLFFFLFFVHATCIQHHHNLSSKVCPKFKHHNL
jgi:hypothetical protein